MIKPVSIIDNAINQSSKKLNPLINKAAAKERMINLIKEFEEVYKSQPNNEALAKHIKNLKESLKMYE